MENVKNQKYVLTDETKVVEQQNGTEVVVHRIKCVNEFTDRFGHNVNKGTLGGFVENYDNLSQDGNAWIADNAVVFGGVTVCDRGYVSCNAVVFVDKHLLSIINGKYLNITIKGTICDDAHCFNTFVYESSTIQDYAWVWDSVIKDRVTIGGNAKVEECELNTTFFDTYLNVGFDDNGAFDISLYKVDYTNYTKYNQYITEAECNLDDETCTFSVETDNC